MLDPSFDPFVKESPISVIVAGLMARVFSPDRLDQLFEQHAQRQYTKTLLFSTLFDLMSQVVCRIRPSIHAAYQADCDEIAVSVTAIYDKLKATETDISAALVSDSADQLTPVIDLLDARLEPLVPGFRVKIVDGNCIEASQHRLQALRTTSAGALPGKSLVVYDPALKIALQVVPCEDGHTQERALVPELLPGVDEGDLWIADRNLCIRRFLFGLVERGGFFLVREHKQLPWTEVSALTRIGQSETGEVYEQAVEISKDDGEALVVRRIVVELDKPTRSGETEIALLSNVPSAAASAVELADLYRKRWRIETAFQEIEGHLTSEINSLGYPRAALFGFCVAVVAHNVYAVVQACLRSVHGAEKIEEEVSGYYVADEIAGTYRGMMIALPLAKWRVFNTMTEVELAVLLRDLAGRVRLSAFKKHRRGPKKKPPKRKHDKKHPHVSTARLLAQQRTPNHTP